MTWRRWLGTVLVLGLAGAGCRRSAPPPPLGTAPVAPAAVAAPAAPPPAVKPPFAPGESLTYRLVWSGIPVGTFSVRVEPMTETHGEPSWHFVMEAATNSVADRIYRVRERIDAHLALDLKRSLRYVAEQEEGDAKRNVILDFDWVKRKVHYRKNGEDRGRRRVPPDTVDPLSVFYVIRTQPIAPGAEIRARVTDGKKTVDNLTVVGPREDVTIDGQQYACCVIEPDLKDLGGVFQKSPDAKLRIWVTADEWRIPVKVSSRVVVGEFTGYLVEHVKPEAAAGAAAPPAAPPAVPGPAAQPPAPPPPATAPAPREARP